MLKIDFKNEDIYKNDAIIILVNNNLNVLCGAKHLKSTFLNQVQDAIQDRVKFTGKFGEVLRLTISEEGRLIDVIVVAVGDEKELQEYQIEEIGGKIYSVSAGCRSCEAKSVGIEIQSGFGGYDSDIVASYIASGALLASYRFDKYRTEQTSAEKFAIESFNLSVKNPGSTQAMFDDLAAVAEGVYLARDLVSEAPNVLYPASYADITVDELEPLGIKITVLSEQKMHELGMGALLGVGQGSHKESKMVIMEYSGADAKDQKPLCFVGKGVTFDTGGISLKPSGNMGDMKYDMGGSAAVVGLIKTLAIRKSNVNAVGVIGLVENMPGSNAQRPGDIVSTMSGRTVEVLNTDAEGRLVLADCLTYVQTNYNPEIIVDLATLTGAILVALANTYGGCFSNDENLSEKLLKASDDVNEKLWRMPLHKEYDQMLKSPVADMANISTGGGLAGSSTAAHFLGRFINKGVKWAHLDIAGMAWIKKNTNPICPVGAVGFGVRLLNKFVKDNYETK